MQQKDYLLWASLLLVVALPRNLLLVRYPKKAEAISSLERAKAFLLVSILSQYCLISYFPLYFLLLLEPLKVAIVQFRLHYRDIGRPQGLQVLPVQPCEEAVTEHFFTCNAELWVFV